MSINKGTIVRTILLLVACVNKLLELKGLCPLPVNNEELESAISDLFIIGTAIWAWWKNNSFTRAALTGDEVVEREKARKKIYG